jgi:quercetin dioxygenase-like cupin family protein
MALLVRAKDIPNGASEFGGGIETRLVYGDSGSLMVGVRPPGFHSIPHVHACEQLNYMMSGELWCFVGEQAFLAHPGDFFRIPANAVHWTWNKSSDSCTVVEAHMPGMQADPSIGGTGVPLYDDDETPAPSAAPTSIFVDPRVYKVEEVERQTAEADTLASSQ